MQRYHVVLEYDGSAFAGWQVQPGQRTIQGVVSEVLQRLLGHETSVEASGRTDAGVHALGQAIAFSTDQQRSLVEIERGLNALLPRDVAAVSVRQVPVDFDPRRWVRSKEYRYRFLERPQKSPLRRGCVWHVRQPLDVSAMQRGADLMVGRHDFSSFRAAGCGAQHAVRTVVAAEVRRQIDEVELLVTGNGFLRHMIRIVAGTLLEVGLGRQEPEWIGEVLQACDRGRAGKTAPAQGLALIRVEYGEGPRVSGDAR